MQIIITKTKRDPEYEASDDVLKTGVLAPNVTPGFWGRYKSSVLEYDTVQKMLESLYNAKPPPHGK